MKLPPGEVLERLGKRDTDLAAMSSQDAQCFCEWSVLVLPKKVLAGIRHFPQTCQLWHADAPRLQRHELRGIPGEKINTSEFRSPEALHIDAVPQERMPGQVVICVGDEDLRAVQDHRGVGLPSQVKFRASRRDGGGQRSLPWRQRCPSGGWCRRDRDIGPEFGDRLNLPRSRR